MSNSINPINNNVTGANNASALNNVNSSSLFSGAPGLTNTTATGNSTDQIKLGDEASKMMQSMGLGTGSSSLSGIGGGDPTTMMIMMMMMMTMASSNNNMKSMMSQMSGTGTAGTTGTGTASGTTAVTGAGKLDTTGIPNQERKASGSSEVGGGQIITSGTVNNTMGTTEITPDKVRADGKPSAAGDGPYKVQAGPVFENRCPCCGKKGVLSYERSTQGNGCPEGMFFCDSKKGGCDADYSVISGKDHGGKNKFLTKVAGNTGTTGVKGVTGATAATGSSGSSSSGSGAGSDQGSVSVNLPGITIGRDEEYYESSKWAV